MFSIKCILHLFFCLSSFIIFNCQESIKINIPYKNNQENDAYNRQNNEYDTININVKNTDAIISIGQNNRHIVRKILVEEPDKALEIDKKIDNLEEIAPETLRELEKKIKKLKNIVLTINNYLNNINLIQQKAEQATKYVTEIINNYKKVNKESLEEINPEKKLETELLKLKKDEIDNAVKILNTTSAFALENIKKQKSAIEKKIIPRVDYITYTLKGLEKALKEVNERIDRVETVENINIELRYLETSTEETKKETVLSKIKIEDQQQKAEAAKKYLEDLKCKR